MTEPYHHGVDVDALKAERAALEAAIIERQRQIDAAETLAWCEARSRRTPDTGTVVTKSASTRRDNQAMTNEWQSYIDATAKKAEQRAINLTIEVVGETLAILQKKLRDEFEARLEAEILKLRNEFLQDRLDQERGTRRLKVVPSDSPAGMIA